MDPDQIAAASRSFKFMWSHESIACWSEQIPLNPRNALTVKIRYVFLETDNK